MAAYKEKRLREQGILIKCVVVRLSSQLTHEVGNRCNRGSECHGEYVPAQAITARHHGSGCKEVA